MKYLMQVAPVKYGNGFVEMAIPYKALYRQEHESRTISDLEARVRYVSGMLNADAVIYIKPLSRKCAGFDAWKEKNQALLHLHKVEAAQCA